MYAIIAIFVWSALASELREKNPEVFENRPVRGFLYELFKNIITVGLFVLLIKL